LIGPSKATLREIQIDGAAKADGILIESVDQVGSRVYMDQAQLWGSVRSDLWVNGLDNTNVQLEDAGYAFSLGAVSITVAGGPLSTAGRETPGRTTSSASRGTNEYDAGAPKCWCGCAARAAPARAARIHDRAVVTVDGSRFRLSGATPPAFDIQNLNGRVTIVATDMTIDHRFR
jgi:hypothetical protein